MAYEQKCHWSKKATQKNEPKLCTERAGRTNTGSQKNGGRNTRTGNFSDPIFLTIVLLSGHEWPRNVWQSRLRHPSGRDIVITSLGNPSRGMRRRLKVYDMQKHRSSSHGAFSFNVAITPTVQKDGEWYVAFCPEVPEANGQGRTPEESVEDLKKGVFSILQDRRADAESASSKGARVPAPA
jgi:predicted RNase H-like HicB family nuclease